MADYDTESSDRVSEASDNSSAGSDSLRAEATSDPQSSSRIGEMEASRGGLPDDFNNDFVITDDAKTKDSNRQANGPQDNQSSADKPRESEEGKSGTNSPEQRNDQSNTDKSPQREQQPADESDQQSSNASSELAAKEQGKQPVGGDAKPGDDSSNVWRPNPQEPPTEGQPAEGAPPHADGSDALNKLDTRNRSDSMEFKGDKASPATPDKPNKLGANRFSIEDVENSTGGIRRHMR